jgi:hypothetical protein
LLRSGSFLVVRGGGRWVEQGVHEGREGRVGDVELGSKEGEEGGWSGWEVFSESFERGLGALWVIVVIDKVALVRSGMKEKVEGDASRGCSVLSPVRDQDWPISFQPRVPLYSVSEKIRRRDLR